LRQPGIKIEKDKVTMNSVYDGAEIHYTLDGSNPDAGSLVYSKPFKTQADQIRAIVVLNGKQSVVTIENR
jgi:hypothetical protein